MINKYKIKVKNIVGEVFSCEFCSKMQAWEICKMYETQFGYEILKLEKIEPNGIFNFLFHPLKESIQYA